MKLVTFEASGYPGRRAGCLADVDGVERVVDLVAACALGDEATDRARVAQTLSSVTTIVLAGAGATDAAASATAAALHDPDATRAGVPVTIPLERARLLPPLEPNSLRDFIAFEDHARAGARRRGEDLNPTWHERPLYYKGNHRSLRGSDETVLRPSFTRELDFEMEVACVVGTRVEDADEETAAAAIFGFMVMNDWSARDVQRVEMAARLGPAKSKDFATSLGPCIVTADELGPQPKLSMTARVNGEVVCSANLGDARWTFAQMIAFVSQGETVWPTDIYGSGTPFGGCMLDQGGPYLEPRDVVELEVERLGVLRNTVG